MNGDICKYYLEWLENVHRQETYKQYIAKKQQTEQNLMDANNQQNENQLYDIDTWKRREEIFRKINKRRKIKSSGASSSKQV